MIMVEVQRTPIEELRIVAKTRVFRNAPEVIRSINWLNTNKAELWERMHSFVHVNHALNGIMSSSESLAGSLRDVRRLQSLLGGIPIPSFERVRSDFYNSTAVQNHITELFETAKRNYPSWAKIDMAYPSDGTPAMGVLIEGFGAYLGKLGGNPSRAQEINRTYVLAFEELLIKEFDSSPLISDVLGWMIEEKASFPSEIQSLIDDRATEFKAKVVPDKAH